MKTSIYGILGLLLSMSLESKALGYDANHCILSLEIVETNPNGGSPVSSESRIEPIYSVRSIISQDEAGYLSDVQVLIPGFDFEVADGKVAGSYLAGTKTVDGNENQAVRLFSLPKGTVYRNNKNRIMTTAEATYHIHIFRPDMYDFLFLYSPTAGITKLLGPDQMPIVPKELPCEGSLDTSNGDELYHTSLLYHGLDVRLTEAAPAPPEFRFPALAALLFAYSFDGNALGMDGKPPLSETDTIYEQEGVNGGALGFNGSSTHVSLFETVAEHPLSLRREVLATRQGVTVSFWVKPGAPTPGSQVMFSRTDVSSGEAISQNGYAFVLSPSTGKAGFSSGGQTIETPAGSLEQGKWAHLAFRFYGGALDILVNGQLAVKHLGVILPESLATLPVGLGGSGSARFTGALDELIVWSTYLSDEALGSVFEVQRNLLLGQFYDPQILAPVVSFNQSESFQMGDLDQNGLFNIFDILWLEECLKQTTQATWCALADLNQDGNLDNADLLILEDRVKNTPQIPTPAEPKSPLEIPGLSAYWKFDEGEATGLSTPYATLQAQDSSESSTDYSANGRGVEISVPGNRGSAVNLNGGFFEAPQFYFSGDFGVSVWVKSAGNSFVPIFSVSDGYYIPMSVSIESGFVRITTQVSNPSFPGDGEEVEFLYSSVTAPIFGFDSNTWRHVAVSYTGVDRQVDIFVDGFRAGGGVLDYPIRTDNSGPPTLVGSIDYSKGQGELDELAIWERALTHQEMLELSIQSEAPPIGHAPHELPGLLAHWTFDDGDLLSAGLSDSSGNDHWGFSYRSSSTTVPAGKFGAAVELENDSFSIDYRSGLAHDLSFSGWIKTQSLELLPIFSQTNGHLSSLYFAIENGNLVFRTFRNDDQGAGLGSADQVSVSLAGLPLLDGEFHHYMVRYTHASKSVEFSVDGVGLGGSQSLSVGIPELSIGNVFLGSNKRYHATATFDDFALYGRRLDDQEVISLFTGPQSSPPCLSPGDCDSDGLTTEEEAALGTNDFMSDSDGDGVSDREEGEMGLNPMNPDSDGDGFSDGEEIANFSDPLDPCNNPANTCDSVVDNDGDGFTSDVDPNDNDPCDTPVGNICEGIDPVDEVEEVIQYEDNDGDGFTSDVDPDDGNPCITPAGNICEQASEPDSDSDGDGLSDYDETHTFQTDPFKADTDGDWLTDHDEIYPAVGYSSASSADSDGDGYSDGEEFVAGTDSMDSFSFPSEKIFDQIPNVPGHSNLVLYQNFNRPNKAFNGEVLPSVKGENLQINNAYNSLGFVTGKKYNGIKFKGEVRDSFYIAEAPGLTSMTIATWFKTPATATAAWQTIYEQNRGGSNWFGLFVKDDFGGPHCRWGHSTTIYANEASNVRQISLDRNKWYHLACVFDSVSQTLVMYVDGLEVGSKVSTEAIFPNTAGAYVGRSFVGEPLIGTLDDLTIWDIALSANEMATLPALLTAAAPVDNDGDGFFSDVDPDDWDSCVTPEMSSCEIFDSTTIFSDEE